MKNVEFRKKLNRYMGVFLIEINTQKGRSQDDATLKGLYV